MPKSTKVTAVISGVRLRLDVPTKCHIVGTVLTTRHKSKQAQTEFIDALAAMYNVNPVTIKLWCSKYEKTWKHGINLPQGTMSFAFAVVPQSSLPTVRKELSEIRQRLQDIEKSTTTSVIKGVSARTLRSKSTTKQLLLDLIDTKK